MKKILSVCLSLILLLSLVSCEKTEDVCAQMTTMQFVQDMGIGINLGNTFEACGDWIDGETVTDFETAWGSPKITKRIIQGYADAGFGVVRIPVAWSNMMDENYVIADEYIDRVKQVTEWVLDCGMKAIVNIHWDGGWWENFPTDEQECMKKYEAVWTQLCEAFGEYDHDLMFESLNEEGCWDSVWNRWGGDSGKREVYDLLGRINQKFVDIVRASGGINATRHLLIAGYATDVANTCDEMFVLPDDPAGRYAVSVHYYTPSTFAIIEEDASWGEARNEWGTDEDIAELEANMKLLEETFIKKGIPVIVGEYGCAQGNKTPDVVRLYITSVCEAIYQRGMCPVLWDTTGSFYDRMSCEFYDAELLEQMVKIRDYALRDNLE